MAKFKDLTGQRFDKLLVIKQIDSDKRTQWLCKCDCGNVTVVQSCNLLSGHSKSCGCGIIEANTRHGHWNERVYRIYYAMKERCYNPNACGYEYYGAIGISVCDEWRKDFQTFYNWAMSHGYSDELSIDRIDPNGNYEPLNCRWADKTTQSYNQKKRVDNTSGYKGISYRKDTKKYIAYINKAGKRYRLGNFSTLEEAIKAREKAEKKYY